MGKLTTHVLDTAGGRPAAGMRIDFAAVGPNGAAPIATVHTNAEGRTDRPLLDGDAMRAGEYELTFHVADYFRGQHVMLADPPKALWAGEHLVLEPLDGGARTRLIARTSGGWIEPFAHKVPILSPLLWPIAALVDRGPGELLHHYMETGMLKGIKARVEAASGS